MSDELDALLAKLTPEERARLLARLTAGTQAGGDHITGDKVGGDKVGRDKNIAGSGSVTVDGTLRGAAVGVNQGTVQLFFGTPPMARNFSIVTWSGSLLSMATSVWASYWARRKVDSSRRPYLRSRSARSIPRWQPQPGSQGRPFN